MNGSWKVVLPVGFVLYSLPLFLRVNGTSDYVIDEEFHIPQGLAFCRKEFDVVRSRADHQILMVIYRFPLVVGPENNDVPGSVPYRPRSQSV